MSWHRGPLLALDFETTSVDPETARIVTATVVDIQPGTGPVVHNWLVSPGVPIPDEAAAIHGVTSEIAEAKGVPPIKAISDLRTLLRQLWTPTVPLVIYNAAYDATLLDRESRRHDWAAGIELLGPIVDPLVIERKLIKARRGGRNLAATCDEHGVKLTDAHTSEGDALAAARLAWKLANRYPQIRNRTLDELYALQPSWYAEQQANFAAFLREQANTAKDVDEQLALHARADAITTDWPVQPYPVAVSA